MHKIAKRHVIQLFYCFMVANSVVHCHYPCGNNNLRVRIGDSSWPTRAGTLLNSSTNQNKFIAINLNLQ